MFKMKKEELKKETYLEVMVRVVGGVIGENDVGECIKMWFRK